MQRGFAKVAEKLPAVADKDIGQVLKTTGMTLLSSVGGASGPSTAPSSSGRRPAAMPARA
jgi:dihydroxyacetone kinase-like protein